MKYFRKFVASCIGAAVVCILPAFAFAQADVFRFDKTVCKQSKKERDAILDVTDDQQHTVRRIEFYGNTNTRDRVLRDELVLKEGNIFDRKDIEKSLKRLLRMKTPGSLTMAKAKVLLDRDQKDLDFIFCVRERPKR